MEEREELYEGSGVVLKVLVILAFFGGAIFFGKTVWEIEFDHTWKHWLALILGEISFLYSFVFVVTGVAMFVIGLTDEHKSGWGLKGTVMILCLAAIFQLVFWGVVYAYYEVFKTVMILLLIVVAMAVWLKLTSE